VNRKRRAPRSDSAVASAVASAAKVSEPSPTLLSRAAFGGFIGLILGLATLIRARDAANPANPANPRFIPVLALSGMLLASLLHATRRWRDSGILISFATWIVCFEIAGLPLLLVIRPVGVLRQEDVVRAALIAGASGLASRMIASDDWWVFSKKQRKAQHYVLSACVLALFLAFLYQFRPR
jgi:hypothetical protein